MQHDERNESPLDHIGEKKETQRIGRRYIEKGNGENEPKNLSAGRV